MTAIREVDLTNPPSHITGLGDATRCMLVLRCGRRVVGRTVVDVEDGGIDGVRLSDALGSAVTEDAVRCWTNRSLDFDERAVAQPVSLRATVAICTRERPDDLARALVAISAHGFYEVVMEVQQRNHTVLFPINETVVIFNEALPSIPAEFEVER